MEEYQDPFGGRFNPGISKTVIQNVLRGKIIMCNVRYLTNLKKTKRFSVLLKGYAESIERKWIGKVSNKMLIPLGDGCAEH